MARYLIVFTAIGAIECLLSLLLFGTDPLPYLLLGITATIISLPLLIRMWGRFRSPWLRFGSCLLGTWLTMVAMVVLGFLITPDPFATARIEERGWVLYVLVDKVARGIVFGALFASIAYVWLWIPIGAVWYWLLRWALSPFAR